MMTRVIRVTEVSGEVQGIAVSIVVSFFIVLSTLYVLSKEVTLF